MPVSTTTAFKIQFKSESTIYQKQIKCHINENEFNYTQNPTILSGSLNSIYSYLTGSYFQPYVTTVGLYNERNELLAVAKSSKPCPIPANTDITFIIRYDT